ncbi:MAG: HlyC/CorC family transporter, partial [Verrucomicrobia bacterium]|nr:HlyC/CorC family transporter [Verrucomicrobiota bacterium]
ETCLFSLNSVQVGRIKKRNAKAAKRIESMLNHPTSLLSTILIGNTVVNVSAASLGFTILATLDVKHAEAFAIPAMTVLLLVFGEVAPKRLAMKRAAELASLYSRFLVFLITIMKPFRLALEAAALLFAKDLTAGSKTLTEDEFLTVVEVGEEEGILDEEERTMVDGIIRLEETQASDVMTPRVDLIGIDLTDPPEEQESIARSSHYRYLPLYHETLDSIEGFLDVPRFLLSGGHDLSIAMTQPKFVPETAPLDTLLTTFQQENYRVAVVSDEFGGTAGLITRGDILEEIAEDVDNEYGEERLTIQALSETSWLVDGSVSLEDINYELDMDLEADGADRIAGWVSAQAERIPRPGEVVEAQGCRATAQTVRRQRIMLVRIERAETPDQREEKDA